MFKLNRVVFLAAMAMATLGIGLAQAEEKMSSDTMAKDTMMKEGGMPTDTMMKDEGMEKGSMKKEEGMEKGKMMMDDMKKSDTMK